MHAQLNCHKILRLVMHVPYRTELPCHEVIWPAKPLHHRLGVICLNQSTKLTTIKLSQLSIAPPTHGCSGLQKQSLYTEKIQFSVYRSDCSNPCGFRGVDTPTTLPEFTWFCQRTVLRNRLFTCFHLLIIPIVKSARNLQIWVTTFCFLPYSNGSRELIHSSSW